MVKRSHAVSEGLLQYEQVVTDITSQEQDVDAVQKLVEYVVPVYTSMHTLDRRA